MAPVFSLRLSAIWLITFFVCVLLPSSLCADTTVDGTISTDTVWTVSGSPYIVNSTIYVRGADGADGITTLSIEPGTTIRMNAGRGLYVGNTSGNPGALVARGTAADPIIFTSNKAEPQPGDWAGIYFYGTTHDATTLMEHCVVDYSGSSGGALYIYASAPTIRNTTIENSSRYDLYYRGTIGGEISGCTLNSGIYLNNDNTVTFTGNTFNYNNAYPISTKADYVHELVNGNTFSNLDSSSCLEVTGGNVTKDSTWASNIPIHVNNNCIIQGTDGDDGVTTLTIESGAVLKVGKNRYFGVGANQPGALVAQGTADQPIVFTSDQASPSPGDWYGIIFYDQSDDSQSILEHCIVEYTGYNGNGAIKIQDAAPSINQCSFSNSSNYDLKYVGSAGGVVSGCTFRNGVYLPTASSVDFNDNAFIYNNSFPIETNADNLHSLLNGNIFTNTDSDSYIKISSGTLTKDSLWPSSIPLHCPYGLTVKGTDGTDDVTTLTIEQGAIIRFGRNRYLSVGAGAGDPGALIANGTDAEPIVFTSGKADPIPGDWYGIRFYNTTDDATSKLEHCTVKYSGYRNNGAVLIQDSAPTLVNCTFSDSSYYDLKYFGTVGGAVTGCTINNGILITTAGNVSFSNNIINQNNSFPVKTYANNVGGIASSNFSNLDAASYIWVYGGTLSLDAVWSSKIPYMIYNSVTVQGTDGADGITSLTIDPGATLKFRTNTNLKIGGGTGDPGALIAQGTSDGMILFTSAESSPAPGDWDQIHFAATAADTSTMDYCVVELAGSSGKAIFLDNVSVPIRNCTIRNNQTYGLYVSKTGANGAEIECNTFESNLIGLTTAYNALPAIEQNNFINNSSSGIRSNSTGLVAENNWWNDSAGPNQSGDQTYGDVDTDPWSTELNQCASTSTNHPPNLPTAPEPSDQEVRVYIANGLTLTWAGGDPDPLDTVTYDVLLGTAADTIAPIAQNVTGADYQISEPAAGITYYWQIVARDNHGLESTGPIWSFTTQGERPDLVVSHLGTTPPGNLQSGQTITIAATILNNGAGPAVDSFMVDISIDGTSLGPMAVNEIMLAGESVELSVPWTYGGGNPSISALADSQNTLAETDNHNNTLTAFLYAVADMTAPVVVATLPVNGSFNRQITNISVSIADSQSEIDQSTVSGSFELTGTNQATISGNVVETDDTYTFTPLTSPLPDGDYSLAFVMADIHGNDQNAAVEFTADSQPPEKPTITGGTVASGVIQARPASNISDQFVIELTGMREDNTSVYVNGIERAPFGVNDWSTELNLLPGDTTLEVWLVDRAENRGPSEWVDINASTANAMQFDYNVSGRIERVHSNP